MLTEPNDAAGVPVLDMALLKGSVAEQEQFRKELVQACVVAGVFYVRNHGIPTTLCKSLLQGMDEFFALGGDEKNEIAFIKSPHWRGYAGVGTELTARKVDVREQIEYGFELPANRTDSVYWALRGPNQWPTKRGNAEWGSHFKSVVQEYMQELKDKSEILLEQLAIALETNPKELLAQFAEEPHVRMKLVRYPPLTEATQSSSTLSFEGSHGVGPHKDYGFFGLLLQDGVGGLQYQDNTTGAWVDATPIPDTFVVTLGEMIEWMTNGAFRATTHRVLVPTKPRLSANYFYNPRPEVEVSKIQVPSAIRKLADENPGQRVVFDGETSNEIFGVYGQNALKGMCRSHPDIVAAHHPELLHLVTK